MEHSNEYYLKKLYTAYKKCVCQTVPYKDHALFVPGMGDPEAKIMFIGEAPGRQEAEQGKPFVGRAGQLLTKLMQQAGIDRNKVFISNTVKFRPPNNRPPTHTEILGCSHDILLREIKIIKPSVICTLGSTAYFALTQQKATLSKIHGKKQQFFSMLLLPTFHPAFILRSPNYGSKLLDDLLEAKKLAENA